MAYKIAEEKPRVVLLPITSESDLVLVWILLMDHY